MKKIKVELSGTGEGLLMHSCKEMEEPKAKKNPTKVYDAKVDAEKAAYRNKDGFLYIPSRCLKACIINAASWYKFGKKSAKPIIAGCSRIEQTEIILLDNKGKPIVEYEIDKRPVVVQQSRIIRARPIIKEWKVKFDLVYDDRMIGDVELLNQILEEAGQRVGLLDNRPAKFGENGCFVVSKFAPEK